MQILNCFIRGSYIESVIIPAMLYIERMELGIWFESVCEAGNTIRYNYGLTYPAVYDHYTATANFTAEYVVRFNHRFVVSVNIQMISVERSNYRHKGAEPVK